MAQSLKTLDALANWEESQERLEEKFDSEFLNRIRLSPQVIKETSQYSDDLIEEFLDTISNKILHLHGKSQVNPRQRIDPSDLSKFMIIFDYDDHDRNVIIRQLEFKNPTISKALRLKSLLRDKKVENAPSTAFKREASRPLCIPEDGVAKAYPGKPAAGDVREWLAEAYPYRERGIPLTLGWLERNDPRAHRALYKQSTGETGPPSDFLSSTSAGIDRLLEAHNLDLSTDEGIEDATRVHSALTSRLFPKKSPNRKRS